MGETPLKNRIDIVMIESVNNYNIMFVLISDMSLVRMRDIRLKCLGLEIYENVPIPRVE